MNEPSKEDLNTLAIIISLGRIYDVLMVLLAETSERGPELANGLQERHAAGKLFFPTPNYTGETFNDNSDK